MWRLFFFSGVIQEDIYMDFLEGIQMETWDGL
jgi:hypothetical protein